MANASPILVSVLQLLATIAPALYTGFTFAYSHVAMPPLITHAPPKLLAKQWLQAYQFAPVFVAPLILLGASTNVLLAYITASSPWLRSASFAYTVAAIAIASIIPYTRLYMEPGINGAGKWKVQELLREDGYGLKATGSGTDCDTSTDKTKSWAETVDMKTIAETWAAINARRYVITGFATVVSAIATVSHG